MAKVDVDELFRLPLSEFTAERNALAKRAGADGAAIKALQKPPVAAWAVNQLYFRERDTYDALIAAADELRRTHKVILEGKKGDLRTAGREHEMALDAALRATLALMKDSGQTVTDATRQQILNTLRALPADEAPGRLTRTLTPGGFEMLAGISLKPGQKLSQAPTRRPPPAKTRSSSATPDVPSAREREKRAGLERAVRDADQRARQAEFEAARAARDETKAEDRVERARRAVEEAQAELAQAEEAAHIASRARETAGRRARDANTAVDKARAALES